MELVGRRVLGALIILGTQVGEAALPKCSAVAGRGSRRESTEEQDSIPALVRHGKVRM